MNGGNATEVINCAVYRGGTVVGEHLEPAAAYAQTGKDGFVWLGLRSPSEAQITELASVFEVSKVALDELRRENPRPRLLQHNGHTLLILRTARYLRHGELTSSTDIIGTGYIAIVFGERFIITARHGESTSLAPLRASLTERPKWLAHGPWTVVHAIIEAAIDGYAEICERFEAAIDDVEEGVFGKRSSDVARIYQLKRELVEFKRAVLPLTRVIDQLSIGTVSGIPGLVRKALNEAADHQHRITEQLTGYDELLTSILSASLTQVGIQQNSDMRKISAWAAIIGVQTTIAGVYGMNFDHMPELHWVLGYPMAVGAMVASALALIWIFRKTGWL